LATAVRGEIATGSRWWVGDRCANGAFSITVILDNLLEENIPFPDEQKNGEHQNSGWPGPASSAPIFGNDGSARVCASVVGAVVLPETRLRQER
jgi:hypothetical protein